MKVTAVRKKFGKYAPGVEFDLPERAARVFINAGKVQAVTGQTYMTRDMVAAKPVPAIERASAEPAPEPEPVAATAPEQPAAEVDSSGAAWDVAMHASSKTKNTDGTWRKRPGPRTTEE